MKPTILVIDDNQDILENITEVLELEEYIVVATSHPKDVFQIAKEEQPDLILCDIMMPELDGYSVLKILKRNEETRLIPFLFLTAKTDASDMRKGMNLGADDYITKPFTTIDLLDAVRMRLEKSAEQLSANVSDHNQSLFRSSHLPLIESQIEEYFEQEGFNKAYKKDHSIYLQGAYPKSIFYIQKGLIRLTTVDQYDKEFTISLLSSGDIFGIKQALSEFQNTESAICLTDCIIQSISIEQFQKLLESSPELSMFYNRKLSEQIFNLEQKLIQLAYAPVRERVATTLLSIAEKTKQDQFDISRHDLAKLVGTARESAIRSLSDLSRGGIISIQGSTISINDKEKLRLEAGSNKHHSTN